MKAVWNGEVIAESANTVVIEGNHYFPLESVKKNFLRKSNLHTVCPWKGEASYYDVAVENEVNKNAAWYYSTPKEAAEEIRGRVAFWHGIQVVE